MGLILRAATGTGWTTGSGLEGPSNALNSFDDENEGHPWPALSKSPRRRMRVAFTCNVCGKRTTRAINPHAYTDGTVFVQVQMNTWFNMLYAHSSLCLHAIYAYMHTCIHT